MDNEKELAMTTNPTERFLLPAYPTEEMIDAGAQRLVRFEDGTKWPDSFSAVEAAAARNEAVRVYLSMVEARPKPPGPQDPPRPPKRRMIA
jgi:hypothetical protein